MEKPDPLSSFHNMNMCGHCQSVIETSYIIEISSDLISKPFQLSKVTNAGYQLWGRLVDNNYIIINENETMSIVYISWRSHIYTQLISSPRKKYTGVRPVHDTISETLSIRLFEDGLLILLTVHYYD